MCTSQERVFSHLLINDVLSNIIETTNPEAQHILRQLLSYKCKLTSSDENQREDFPLNMLYEQLYSSDIIAYEILKSALLMQKTEKQFRDVVNFLNDICCSISRECLGKACYLLHVVIDVSDARRNYLQAFFELATLDCIEMCMIESLYTGDKETKDRITNQLLPKYLTLVPLRESFVDKLYHYAIETKSLLFLCVVSNQLYKNKEIIKYSFLKSEQFWELLEECISHEDAYNLKLAVFVLSKTVEYIYNNHRDIEDNAFYISDSNEIAAGMKNAWATYFLLLDMSQEKQLHLIEPCLMLLDRVKKLPWLWQSSIYKLLLKHPQSYIVYSVAENILSQPCYNGGIISHVFEAINRNDCTNRLKNVFLALEHFTARLTQNQFEDLLSQWLLIAWNPVATWHFCRYIFTINIKFKLPLTLLISILRKIGGLPDIYVRCNCIKLILNYSRHNNLVTFEELLSVSQFLYNFDDREFSTYIKSYETYFREYEDCFHDVVNSWTNSKAYLSPQIVKVILSIVANLNLENVIFRIKKTMVGFDLPLKENIYIHLFNHFSDSEILEHIENRVANHKDNIDQLALLLKKVVSKHDGNQNIYHIVLCVIGNADFSIRKKPQIITYFLRDKDACTEMFVQWVKKHQADPDELNHHLCVNYIELFIDIYLKKDCEKLLCNVEEAIKIMTEFLKSKDDIVILKIFQALGIILSYKEVNPPLVFKYMHTCANELLISERSIFREAADLFVTCVYNSRHIMDERYRNKVLEITDALLLSNRENDYFLHLLAKHLKRMSMECPENMHTFAPICIELFLQGMITNKSGRTEYHTYQEIAMHNDDYEKCPNFIKMKTRLLALECLLGILSCGSKEAADQCATLLIGKYKQFYKKRYFPDSQVNFHQFRIIQLLLIIQPLVGGSSDTIINFIIDSFCEEIHQPCVKQLMEWLLIISLKHTPQGALKQITSKMDVVNRTQPSSIVAFIPIIYHLALLSEEEHWSDVFDVLVLWTMGANFKLRVFSQVAIVKLYEGAKQRHYLKIQQKYQFLYLASVKVMECSREQFNTILKQDYDFFHVFAPCRDFCLETILIDLPRMNKVNPSEWENVAQYEFSNVSIPISNKCRILSDHISSNYGKSSIMQEETIPCDIVKNVQKKITPWKMFLDQDGASKESNEFILLASLIDKATNLGGLTRTCEVFGVKKLVINKGDITKNSEFKNLSMSSENWIEFVEVKVDEMMYFLQQLKSEGYTVIGAEQTSHSVTLGDFKFPKKSALVLGNEKEGIPPEIISLLDQCIEIPQFGVTRSLNVHVAGALFMWEYAKQNLT